MNATVRRERQRQRKADEKRARRLARRRSKKERHGALARSYEHVRT